MRKHFNLFILAISAALFFTACEEDLGGGGGTIIPDTISLTLSSDAGFISSDATINAGESFSVRLIGEKGENDLQAIEITQNGIAISVSDFTVDGNSEGANPFLLFGNDLSSFTKDITIVTPLISGTYTYSFILRDLAGDSETRSVVITVNATPPSITYVGSGMIMAELGNLVSVPIVARAGTNPMLEIGVYHQGGVAVDAENLYFGDLMSQFPTNPAVLQGQDKQSFEVDLFIRATLPGANVYTIVITDEGGEPSSDNFEISTGTKAIMIEGALLNSGGPTGQGGLDLDNGMSVGSSDAQAEIKDEGIDTDLPNDVNWLRRISGANGAEIRQLIPNENGLAENFAFENILVKEQILALWENGIGLTEMNDSGELMTSTVVVGDVFVVSNNIGTFLISIKEVNETPDDNADNYVIDIKQ